MRIDTRNHRVAVGGEEYEMLVEPSSYVVKRNYKYTTISCTDGNFRKICVKVFIYDNGETVVVVMDERCGYKMTVIKR